MGPYARPTIPLHHSGWRRVTITLQRMTNAAHAAIVVIESHPEHLDYITTLLRRAGYRVAGFATAAKALRHIGNDATSLIITDVFMPGLDGFEVLRELKRSHLELPVVAVTGGDPHHAQFLDAMRHMGASAGLTKPIDASALLDAVTRLIGRPVIPATSDR
jgi:DNA-binding NtrC family response regulator